MGCGESKHEVATGNTILRKKSNTNTNTNTNDNTNDNTNSKNSKDIETVIETNTKDNTTNSSVQQQPENVNNIEDNKDNIGGAVEADDAKDINENNAVNEGDDIEIDKEKEGGGGGGGDSVGDEKQEGERFISPDSPNHFFSSRKDEEGVEGIVSEGKSDYYDSPRIAAGKEDLLNENVKAENNAAEEKEVVEETKAGKENGEAVNVKEENVVKEAEPEAAVEAKVLSPIADEKNQNDKEEDKADTPSKDKDTK